VQQITGLPLLAADAAFTAAFGALCFAGKAGLVCLLAAALLAL